MSDPAAVQSYLRSIFQSAPDKVLRGSELAVLLKVQHPGFAPQIFGCFNLRDFLRKFVPEIVVVAKSGGDVIYGLKREKGTEEAKRPGFDAGLENWAEQGFTIKDSKVWKTFATPSSKFLLCGNPTTSEVQVIPPSQTPPGAPWVRIPSCPEDTHKKIAQDFIATLPDANQRAVLGKTFETHPWWIYYLHSARQIGQGINWLSYRRQRIEQEFKKALHAVGIQGNYSVIGRFDSYQRELRTPAQLLTGLPQDFTPSPELRRIISAALDRMSETELRSVWLPIGLVLDALKRD